ncbi:MAG: DUF6580 family putative transport protein [Owenweeksia sp.]|nr:DUF6580 family putative transport protein [Owenweeksia sp.]
MFFSDLLINNIIYAGMSEGFTFFTEGFYYIYAAIILSVLIGKYATNGFKILPLAAAGIGSTLLFFLVTNFGVWYASPLYAPNFSGLMASYTAALPFLINQLLGTAVYGTVLFGAAYYIAGTNRQAALDV